MTGIDHQALLLGKGSGLADLFQLLLLLCNAIRLGVVTGMQFDSCCACALDGKNLLLVSIEENRNRAAGLLQTLHCHGNPGFLSGHVQSTLGSQLLGGFRYQTDMFRLDALGNRQHLFGDRHFKIHRRADQLAQQLDIAVLDVTTVLAQMDGNAVCTGLLAQQRRLDRIGITTATGLTHGGDMVDVHTKQNALFEVHAEDSLCRIKSSRLINGRLPKWGARA